MGLDKDIQELLDAEERAIEAAKLFQETNFAEEDVRQLIIHMFTFPGDYRINYLKKIENLCPNLYEAIFQIVTIELKEKEPIWHRPTNFIEKYFTDVIKSLS